MLVVRSPARRHLADAGAATEAKPPATTRTPRSEGRALVMFAAYFPSGIWQPQQREVRLREIPLYLSPARQADADLCRWRDRDPGWTVGRIDRRVHILSTSRVFRSVAVAAIAVATAAMTGMRRSRHGQPGTTSAMARQRSQRSERARRDPTADSDPRELIVLPLATGNGGEGSSAIVLVAPTGRRAATLTPPHAGSEDNQPTWPPDGKWPAFTRTTDARRSFQIHVSRQRHRRAAPHARTVRH